MGAHNQGWGPGDARRVPRLSMPCTSCNGVRVEGAKTLKVSASVSYVSFCLCIAIQP